MFQGIWDIYQVNLRKPGPNAPIFLKLSNFIILTYGTLDFLFRMGSSALLVNQFKRLNNYSKSNFENSEIRDSVPTFWNFIREKFSKKSPLFQTFNANILRNAYAREINESIFTSSHEGLSYEGNVKFLISSFKKNLTSLR